MKTKILVADDSLTIQKVVRITLATSPYEIEESLDEKSLFDKLGGNTFDLLLLDFNFSEQKSGIELATEINKHYPDLPILAMLGTFDSVDEEELEKAGIKDQIIKPFESGTLIQKCNTLVSIASTNDNTIFHESMEDDEKETDEDPQNVLIHKIPKEELADQWTVNAPSPVEENSNTPTFDDEQKADPGKTPLELEIEDWGGDIPEVINSSSNEEESETLPPVIEKETTTKEDDFEVEFDLSPEIRPDVENQEMEEDDKEEIPIQNLWETDEEIVENQESTPAPSSENEKHPVEMTDEIKEILMKEMEAQVKKFCAESIEKVAWEVIPDLAENLINKKLNEISQSLNRK